MERLGERTQKIGVHVDVPETVTQRFIDRSGVVLKRGNYMEGNMAALLFLKSSGTTWCYVPGASKGSLRFGGALEPFVWGRYHLYQSKKRRTYLREVDVTDDFWSLRKRPGAVVMSVRWAGMLERFLIPGYPYDTLLALLYWAMKALEKGVEPDAVHARFLWRWLLDWGIAPDFGRCGSCGVPLRGEGAWLDGAFVCKSCAHGLGTLRFDEFAAYAMSKSFVPQVRNEEMLRQARELQRFFVKNLEENR